MNIPILPAIDLKNGQCVRLRQGKADEVTVYSSDPVEMALHWQNQGGDYLHVVDLDGAFQGHPVHQDIIARIVEALSIPVEVGGGLRTTEDIATLLNVGVDRVIIGTRACDAPDTLGEWVKQFGGERIAVGIDARDGQVQVKGWTETTGALATELATQMSGLGVQTIIYTDTARDGMLDGVNINAMAAMLDAAPQCGIIASGGVSTVEDIKGLAALERPNCAGAIVGKALYEGRVTIEALKQAR